MPLVTADSLSQFNSYVFAACLLTTFNPGIGCVNERMAIEKMGHTQASWDNESGKEPQPASSSKAWADLTAVEKQAAVVLGYDELSWDFPWPATVSKQFAQLTAAEQAAAVELGYDATSWDNESGDEPQPAAGSTGWSELSNEEKAAAMELGYNGPITWDNDPPALPASASKTFADLNSGENASVAPPLALISLSASSRTRSCFLPADS